MRTQRICLSMRALIVNSIFKKSALSFAGLLAIVLMLPACGGSDVPKAELAPDLDFECGLAESASCRSENSGKTVFIGLHTDPSLHCGNYFAIYGGGESFDQIGYSFDYSSITKTIAIGEVLTGLATHWVNAYLMPVFSMEASTFRVCAFIDLNDNFTLDLLEPILETTITVGSDFLPLSNWRDY